MSRHRSTVAATALALVAVASCSDSDGAPAPSTTVTPSAVTAGDPAAEDDDGVLRIGLLVPLTGPGADIGASLRDAAELAVSQVNAAGGVGGRDVQLRIRDEGADIATASRALDDLLRLGVDAIVGPSSSTTALGVLGTATREQVVTCSPTATSLALDAFPDDGWFFRTAPSDSLQAEAIARTVDQTGLRAVSVLYVDDSYGRAFADAVSERLAARSIAVRRAVPYSPSDQDLDDEAAAAAGASTEVVVVLGEPQAGPRLVGALMAQGGSVESVIVSDALRGAMAMASTAANRLDSADYARITGIGPHALHDDPVFVDALRAFSPSTPGLFAVNAFDCVLLLAVAATDAGATTPAAVASRMVSTSSGGTRCTTFAGCLDALAAGRDIDYDGPSGQLQLDQDGHPNRGLYDVFGFDEFGTEDAVTTVVVSR